MISLLLLWSKFLGDAETGFIVQKEGTKDLSGTKTYPKNPSPKTPVCCGSNTGSNIQTESTGNFTRKASGISFKIKNNNNFNYPPEKIKNLKVIIKDSSNIRVEFTATGDDLDYGTGD